MSRDLIHDEEFKSRHRSKPTAFSRIRTLTFSSVIILLRRKSLKSLQVVLQDMAEKRDGEVVTAGALTQARANWRYPAVHGTHAYALASARYDMLNGIAIDRVLGKARDYEVDLAIAHHLPQTRENDLLIFDRNYPSYLLMALLVSAKRQFVRRGSAAAFATARQMLPGPGTDDQMVTLTPHHPKVEPVRFHDLPEAVKVRLVRVMLSTGESEVRVTNLLDTPTFPTAECQAIYHLRWGVAGFYHRLNSRLNLVNFTGNTAQAVYPDCYAAVYLTGLETLLTGDVNQSLAAKPTPYPQPVNHAVAFHAINNQAFELLAADLDSQTLIERLELRFTKTPTLKRSERNVPRKTTS